MLIQHRNIYL